MIKDLEVYKKSVELAITVYKVTARFPKHESLELSSQMRRAAVSIACNLSEGGARGSTKDFVRFIGISRGSCAELLTLIEIAQGIGWLVDDGELRDEVTRIGKMLTQLQKSLRARATNS
ncbi:MAG TPA: four helix bundle protein [Fimbriimonadaceae bacterium]|nr:four helix bundle protein [Fimbriimonadaceae bacterium]